MKFSRNVWGQLKNKTADALITALIKDGWYLDEKAGTERVYRHPDGRHVSIHYHTGKTYGPNLLKALLNDIGWSENVLQIISKT